MKVNLLTNPWNEQANNFYWVYHPCQVFSALRNSCRFNVFWLIIILYQHGENLSLYFYISAKQSHFILYWTDSSQIFKKFTMIALVFVTFDKRLFLAIINSEMMFNMKMLISNALPYISTLAYRTTVQRELQLRSRSLSFTKKKTEGKGKRKRKRKASS